ncbi:MAG: hypothetical protein JO320_16235, partial [Alphaproteobacteria bacterium]|nr:hypothetical protein [Alphaproteobacteria bacterium]
MALRLSDAGKTTLVRCPTSPQEGTTIMILDPNARMAEVVRLTRAGRLAEATALLQRVPQKQQSPEASKARDPESMSMALRGGQPVGMVPPRSRPTYWTAPGVDAQQHTVAALSEGSAQPNMAEVMRGLLDRLGQRGASRGLRGMAGDFAQNAKPCLPGGSRFNNHSYANEAGSRRYKLFIPGRYCAEPLPLVVMLHGCKQSPDDFATGTR